VRARRHRSLRTVVGLALALACAASCITAERADAAGSNHTRVAAATVRPGHLEHATAPAEVRLTGTTRHARQRASLLGWVASAFAFTPVFGRFRAGGTLAALFLTTTARSSRAPPHLRVR
jgi:hypothetical protein